MTKDTQGGPEVFYWDGGAAKIKNFGDQLSPDLVSRFAGVDVKNAIRSRPNRRRLLAVGSILHYASEGDCIWGAGVSGNYLSSIWYKFSRLEIRAVRGPLTQNFLRTTLKLDCPGLFGDPGLLVPYVFPEFKREKPEREVLVVAHFLDKMYFGGCGHAVMATDEHHWTEIVAAIVSSNLVVSTSLHGVVLAEAFGVPARLLRIGSYETLFKYQDYYEGSGRRKWRYAESLMQAVGMGGEDPPQLDLDALREAFPWHLWGRGISQ